MLIGYARVSSKDQNLDRQIEELKKYGCKDENIFKEKITGKNFERPVYQKMRTQLGLGSVLVVHSLSRLGRNKEMILEEWRYLTNKGVDIVILDMPLLDTRKYKELEGVGKLVTDIVLQLLSWMVETERENIRTAQREGIEIAKKNGKYKGRPLKYHKDAKGKDKLIYDNIINMLENNASVVDIHRKTDASRNTIYKIKKQYNLDKLVSNKNEE